MTDYERGTWILRLEDRPSSLSKDETRKLRVDLDKFLRPALRNFFPDFVIKDAFAKTWFKRIRAALRKLRMLTVTKQTGAWTLDLNFMQRFSLSEEDGQFKISKASIMRPTMMWALHEAMRVLDKLLRRCPLCKRLFIRKHKQRYCKKEHADRTRIKRFRNKKSLLLHTMPTQAVTPVF